MSERSERRHIDWAAIRAHVERLGAALETGLEPGPDRIRELREERRRQLAERRAAVMAAGPAAPVLILRLGAEFHALPLGSVAGVVPMAPITPLPRALPALCGVMNRHGEAWRVFDLARLLGLPAGECRHVVLLRGAERVGMAVDRAERVGDASSQTPARTGPYVSGYFTADGTDSIAVLDPATLLRHIASHGESPA